MPPHPLNNEGHAHFITFSCYRRRKLLDTDQAKKIVIHYLSTQLKNQSGSCTGFVIMPDHVHAIVSFNRPKILSVFVSQWKRRTSMRLKKFYRNALPKYAATMNIDGPMWQRKYYTFNIFSDAKALEKLTYIHNNPVVSGLVRNAMEWKYSSARWYAMHQSVGVPITPSIIH
jgi:putative transposase